MKEFENPTIEVVNLHVSDVITTSPNTCDVDCDTHSCNNDMGCPVDF